MLSPKCISLLLRNRACHSDQHHKESKFFPLQMWYECPSTHLFQGIATCLETCMSCFNYLWFWTVGPKGGSWGTVPFPLYQFFHSHLYQCFYKFLWPTYHWVAWIWTLSFGCISSSHENQAYHYRRCHIGSKSYRPQLLSNHRGLPL